MSGMIAARSTRTPAIRLALAFVIGLVTHVMLDAVPHADYGFMPRRAIAPIILAEGLLVAAVSWVILRKRMPTGAWLAIVIGVAGATLPDARFAADKLLPLAQAHAVTRATYWFHSWFHAGMVSMRTGVITQCTAAVLLLGSLFLFPRVARTTTPE